MDILMQSQNHFFSVMENYLSLSFTYFVQFSVQCKKKKEEKKKAAFLEYYEV